MADNVTSPAGPSFRTKDTGTAHIPLVGLLDQANVDALGLVATNPAANTLLGRLKAIADALGVEGGYLDTVEALLTALNSYVDGLEGLLAKGPQTAALSLSTTPSTDQDPIFDHVTGTSVSVPTTAGGTGILQVPAGCKFLRIDASADIVVRTDRSANDTTANGVVADNGMAIRIIANQPETIPVIAGNWVRGLALSSTATVRACPMKVR